MKMGGHCQFLLGAMWTNVSTCCLLSGIICGGSSIVPLHNPRLLSIPGSGFRLHLSLGRLRSEAPHPLMPRKLNSTNLSPKPKAFALRLVLYLLSGEEEERGTLRINHWSQRRISPHSGWQIYMWMLSSIFCQKLLWIPHLMILCKSRCMVI